MSINKVRVEICGAQYVVGSENSDEYVLALAETLNADLNALMSHTTSVSVTAAAVITALGYLDDARKSAQSADNMRTQIKDYLEDSAGAKQAAEDAHREIERLRREIGYLKERSI